MLLFRSQPHPAEWMFTRRFTFEFGGAEGVEEDVGEAKVVGVLDEVAAIVG